MEVIDGIKRKSRIFAGDSIVWETDSRMNMEDVVVCLYREQGYSM